MPVAETGLAGELDVVLRMLFLAPFGNWGVLWLWLKFTGSEISPLSSSEGISVSVCCL